MSRLLTTESPLIVLPSLARELGLEEAIILQQLHYLLGSASTISKGRAWVYNTYEQWADLLPIPLARIKRAFTKLRKLGLIVVEKLARWKTNRTNYYSIDYARLADIVQGSNQIAGTERISLSSSAQPNKPANASAQTRPIEPRKNSAPIGAKPADPYTKRTTKNPNKEFLKPEAPKIKSAEAIAQPTTPEASPQQQTAAHPLIRSLWQHLRACHIDIALDDPALTRWQTTGQARDIRQRALDLHMTNRDAWWPAHALELGKGRTAA